MCKSLGSQRTDCCQDLQSHPRANQCGAKIFLIKGTPSSGKSALATLLYQYLSRHHDHQNDKLYFVRRLLYEDPVDSQILRDYFSSERQDTIQTWWLFDEGQLLFNDPILLSSFKANFSRTVSDRHDTVIIFSSYGSESTPISNESPFWVPERCCVPMYSKSGPSLALDEREIAGVIAIYQKTQSLPVLDGVLTDMIMWWTFGHVGAVTGILDLIARGLRSGKQCYRFGTVFDEDTLWKSIMLSKLIAYLWTGPLSRGLPTHDDIRDADNAVIFLGILKATSGRITNSGTTKIYSEDALLKCRRRGWLLRTEGSDGEIYHQFPSPLHASCVSLRLQPPVNDCLSYPTIYDLSVRHSSISGKQSSPPEAQYSLELYRALISLVGGPVLVSPEYSADKGGIRGRIDYYVEGPKWGFELLREGDRIREHLARFEPSGAYGQWLTNGDLMDYIILDFRRSEPTRPLSKTPQTERLFHVVYSENLRYWKLYDCELNTKVEWTALINTT